MSIQVSCRDENGKPTHVDFDDGFVYGSRPYKQDEDAWIEGQLDPNDFIAIRIGADTEWLIHQVNKLKRENFLLKREVKLWQKAQGI